MKVQLLIPATILVSVALVPLMKVRKKEQVTEDKRSMLMDIKLRVTEDVLEEYKSELIGIDDLIEQKKRQINEMQKDVDGTQLKRDETKNNAEICAGLKKSATDELTVVEIELNHLQATMEKENEKQKAEWTKEVATLKSRLAAQSSVCNFVRKDAQGVGAFCKQEVPKAVAPNPEAPKAVAPNPDTPKAVAPNPEAPKAAAPQQEAPNVPALQQEAPKAAAPNPEVPKAAAPNPEAPKAAAPNPELPNAAAPNPEAPKAVAPNPEVPNAAAPQQEAPKVEAPQQEAPNAAAPQQEAPKVEAPNQ